ncbi:enoyl-(Acyl carrier protein) reductase domain-containing protein [Ditylenchus destructor]|uniref:Enoyl-(Acyl carrier protein) reductase domain-containing protein n=1 Tax=Ditylenchus destructor TaxID=166010 RepID=A0AAD4MZD1_9BILA|nr:enoyl-(Acyl carrier protein) reductase domain-containing protein [Ditylenchus destructor]
MIDYISGVFSSASKPNTSEGQESTEMQPQAMPKKFEGKVVLVTGAGVGIGQDLALEFGKDGAFLALQSQESLNETEKMLVSVGVPSEKVLKIVASNKDSDYASKIIKETAKKFGKIDVLINNLEHEGLPVGGDPNSIDSLDYLFKHHLRNAVELTQFALPYLQKSKGNVVSISGCSSTKASASFPFEATINAALDMFTKSYADKYGYLGVRINTVNPSYVRTEPRDPMARRCSIIAVNQLVEKYAMDNCSLKRVGSARDVSRIVVFLASEGASYVTGANWLVDGGTSLCSQQWYRH